MTTKLNIFQININSLISIKKRKELEIFLNEHKSDLVLLCETKLNKQKINFKNFKFIRNDRPYSTRGCGTGVLIKNTIKFNIIPTPNNFTSIECTIIELQLENQKKILIASIYVTPTQNTLNTNKLSQIIKLAKKNTEIIIGGDFNAHHPLWKNLNTNNNGSNLYNWYTNNNLQITLKSTLYPTRYTHMLEAYIDLFLISPSINISFSPGYSNYLQTFPFESDHAAIKLSISLDGKLSTEPPTTIHNFKNTNGKEFNTKLNTGIFNINIPENRNMNAHEIDQSIESLSNLFIDTIETTVPKIAINPNSQIPLPNNILKLIEQKNKLRRVLHNYKNKRNNNTSVIKSEINCMNIIIKDLIKNHYNHHHLTKLQNIRPDNNLFKNIKRFSCYKTRAEFPNILTSTQNNITTTHINTEQKANALG